MSQSSSKPASDEVIRSINLPPQPGEILDLYQVAECTPQRLHLRVRNVITLVWLGVGLVAIWIGVLFWRDSPANGSQVNIDTRGAVITVDFLVVAVGIYLALNLGKSILINAANRTITVTRFFVFSHVYSADQVQSVVIDIKKPIPPGQMTSKNSENSLAPPQGLNFAKRVELYMTGKGVGSEGMKYTIANALLWSPKEWPLLGATAIELTRLLKLPLEARGALDQMDPAQRTQLAQIEAAANIARS